MLKSWKKILLIISILILTVFFFTNQINATTLDVGLKVTTQAGLGAEDVRVTIAKIINSALGLLGIIVVILISYAGYIYLTAFGDKEQIEKAKKILITGLIGLILILAAYSVTAYILSQIIKATGGEMGKNVPITNNINGNQTPEGDDDGEGGLPQPKEKEGYALVDNNGKKTPIDSYAINKTISSFYSYGKPNASSANIQMETAYDFSKMMATNRTISFIYADKTNPNAIKYYLVLIHGKAGTGGSWDGAIIGAKDYFSFAVKDEPVVTVYPSDKVPTYDAYADKGDTLLIHNIWATCCADGEVIYIGDGKEALSFELKVNSFKATGMANPEWYFFSPEHNNGLLLATSFPASVTINFLPKQIP